MSKIGALTAFLEGSHKLGNTDGLREYHAARLVMAAKRKRKLMEQVNAISDAIRPYRVWARCNGETVVLQRHDTKVELTI
jgi:hypothetical protein